jgi:flagellar protein FlgJ
MNNMTAMISGTHRTPPEVPAQNGTRDAKLRRVCADFESIFMHYILKSARRGLPENGVFDKTYESKIYKSMVDEQMALSVARGRGMGLGQLLYEQLTGDRK